MQPCPGHSNSWQGKQVVKGTILLLVLIRLKYQA